MPARLKAMDIANFYVQLANSIPDDTIDSLKVNNLLYYAQGASLVILNRPIFNDDIHAWDYGPVIPGVYHMFKCCGQNIIEGPSEYFDESLLMSEELNLLIDVYVQYGKYTGLALKSMSNKLGSPWQQIYHKGENTVIPLSLISEYFSTKEKIHKFELDTSKIPIIDAAPVEWDSAEDAVYD